MIYLYFVRSIAILTSGISMVFTAIFALYLSSAAGELNIYLEILVVVAGACLDITKYLCWGGKRRRVLYIVFAVWLSVLSCVASIACFVTQENRNIDAEREKTSAYAAHQTNIERLKRLITDKEALVKTLMSSQYHDQWEKANAVMQEISALNLQLFEAKAALDEVGLNQAISHSDRAAFFEQIARWLHKTYQEVVMYTYIAFSVSIELAPIILLALVREQLNIRQKSQLIAPPTDSLERNDIILRDILSGEMRPVIRQIIKKYNMRYATVRQLFDTWIEGGFIRESGKGFEVVHDNSQ